MAMGNKVKHTNRSGANGKQPVDQNKRIVPVYPPLPHKGRVKTNFNKT